MDHNVTPPDEAGADRREGPISYSRPLTRDQVEAARALVAVVVPGGEYSSAGIMEVVRGSSWVLVQLVHPTDPNSSLIVVVPIRHGGRTGFAFVSPRDADT